MSFTFTADHAKELRFQLEDASVKCSERGLYQSAKWAAELLTSLADFEDDSFQGSDTEPDSPMQTDGPHASIHGHSHRGPVASRNSDLVEAALEAKEAHKYLLAKSYFDTREFDRCAAVFLPPATNPIPLVNKSPSVKARAGVTPQKAKGRVSSGSTHQRAGATPQSYPKMSQKALFLTLYAKYLAGEKRKDEESEMVLGPADGGQTVNKELADLARGLEGWFDERKKQGLEEKSQGWLEYLYGIVLLKGKNEQEAKHWLIRSVHRYPFHWGAWNELNDLLENMEDLKRVGGLLPQNIMTLIFHLYCSQELYQATDETHQTLNELESIFPESAFLKTQRALLYYHSKDFEEAISLFQELLKSHPHRLDSLDHYSNILYVMNQRPQLAFLAQVASATDKFRPETCCVIGNYYSLKSEHEKAVMYFRRALTLDRSFLSAWTLMGHEYIEMKNTHAAIESYRRAVDVNRKDYRAWYGLGQAYEVLDMSFYALFYYQRAAALRPFDPKMWQAVGSCYSKMGKVESSIRAYKRAVVAGTYYEDVSAATSFGSGGVAPHVSSLQDGRRKILDPEMTYQIATLYERAEDIEQAAAYMELTVQQETGLPATGVKKRRDTNTSDQDSDLDSTSEQSDLEDDPDDPELGYGTGVTATTSKARLWLARWALRNEDLERADALAAELCQDGVEVEEAKALIREVRAMREGALGSEG